MMWNVEIGLERDPACYDEDGATEAVAELLDVVADYAPAASVSPDRVSVTLSIDAEDHLSAIVLGTRIVDAAATKVDLPWTCVESASAKTEARFASELTEPNFPAVLGVHELANRIGVTRQRASQLAGGRSFPTPVVRLASGPVWLASAVENHLALWDRRPGRPRRPV